MKSLRRHALPLAGLPVALLVVGLLAYSRQTGVAPPSTVADAVARARSLGLHVGADNQLGKMEYRVVISETPVTPEDATALSLGDADDPRWVGRVVAILPGSMEPDGRYTAWGRLWLFGDRELIHKLTTP